jgi:hypothetical protein
MHNITDRMNLYMEGQNKNSNKLLVRAYACSHPEKILCFKSVDQQFIRYFSKGKEFEIRDTF